MTALARFQLSGYVRSQRVLQPLIAVFLLFALILLDLPGAATATRTRQVIVGGYGDAAALMFPIWAWTARGLLDTEPDGQRELSLLGVGHSMTHAVSGLLAAFTVNSALAALVLTPLLTHGLLNGVGPGPALLAVALHLLAALAATLVGAWTSRAVIPSQAISILALLGACATFLLLGLGPLAPLGIPMISWLTATHDGPNAFTAAFPALTTHLLLWTTAATTPYLTLRHHRP